MAVAQASPAAAFRIFGMSFFEREEETAIVPDAQPYTLDFKTGTAGDDLTKALEQASSLFREKDRPPPGTAGLVARARGDYGRLLAALYSQGHYGGTITILVDGRMPASIRPDEALADPVPVSVAVEPGPLFHFGEISIEGLPPPIDTREDEARLDMSDWAMRRGKVARSGAILTAEGRLTDVWKQRGHAKARIAGREVVADHRTKTVDVTLSVEPGPEARIGAVDVTGMERMNPAFVVRQTGLKPGEDYDPDTLERAKERLRRLEVFSSVSLQEAELIGADGLLPVTFNLAERKRRLIGGGVSYSTTDGATVEAYWAHRNLFGQAESLRLDASVSRLGAANYDEFSYLASATFKKPGVITPDTDLTAQVLAEREYVDTYERLSASAKVGLQHRFSERLTGSTAVNVERSRIEDAFGTNDYLLLSLPSALEYDSRNNKLDPTKGVYLVFNAEPFVDLNQGTLAFAAKGSAAAYRALDERGRMVVAGRFALGSIVGGELDEVPADRRYYLGGGGSIRGYEYRTVGPEIGGEVVGGLSFFEASLELRLKVRENIGIVPFVDVGAAYPDSVPDFGEDIHIGAGIGLRYYTSLGPLRFDVAVPLNRRDDDPSVAFYVGLGQAF